MDKVLTIFTLSLILSLTAGIRGPFSGSALRPVSPIKLATTIPQLDMNRYWGPGNAENYIENNTIVPFTISFDTEINNLRADLSKPLNDLQEPLEGTQGFERGFNSNRLKTLVQFWRDDYLQRWSERQTYLNRFPQFKTQIQGLQIHYIHVKPQLTTEQQTSFSVLPLLLLHGWPGSVREYYEMIPMLSTPNNTSQYVFEVIVPSLPGFGWSQAPSKQELGSSGIAVIFKNLMSRLGHEKFLILGGDWGGLITSQIATLFPNNVLGAHSSICFALSAKSLLKGFIASLAPNFFLTPEQIPFHFPLGSKIVTGFEELGFFHMHATKPDTIGAALTGNPVGLLAYILEKFSTWTNPDFKFLADGGFERRFSLDSLLDNVMIYYLSNSITTSARLYYENFAKPERDLKLTGIPTNVPYGCARFRYDLFHSLDWQLKDKYQNLIHSAYIQEGGHFPYLEIPGVVYNDFIDFMKKVNASAKPVSSKAPDALYDKFVSLTMKAFSSVGGQPNDKAFEVPDALFNNFVSLMRIAFASVAGDL